MNKVLVNGNIVRDMEVKDTGKCLVGTFTIANNIGYGEEQKTNFINCVLFGQVAESTVDYCKKGDLIGIKGRVQRIDTSKPIEIIAEKVTFLSSRKESEEE